jgi:hypothetical protein
MLKFRPNTTPRAKQIGSMYPERLEKEGSFFGGLLPAKKDRGPMNIEFLEEDLKEFVASPAPILDLHGDKAIKEVVGQITHHQFDPESKWTYVWGHVGGENEMDKGLRRQVLNNLKNGKRPSLSVCFNGQVDPKTGAYIPHTKRIKEVSLVDKPRFEGTHILTVKAGADSLAELTLEAIGTVDAMDSDLSNIENLIATLEHATGKKLTDAEKGEIAALPNPSYAVGQKILEVTFQRSKESAPKQEGSAAASAAPPAQQQEGASGELSAAELALKSQLEDRDRQLQYFKNEYKSRQAPSRTKILESLGKVASKDDYAKWEHLTTKLSEDPDTGDAWRMLEAMHGGWEKATSQGVENKSELAKLRKENDTLKRAQTQWQTMQSGRSKAAEAEAEQSSKRQKADNVPQPTPMMAETKASAWAAFNEKLHNNLPNSISNPARGDQAAEFAATYAALRNSGFEVWGKMGQNPNMRMNPFANT